MNITWNYDHTIHKLIILLLTYKAEKIKTDRISTKNTWKEHGSGVSYTNTGWWKSKMNTYAFQKHSFQARQWDTWVNKTSRFN